MDALRGMKLLRKEGDKNLAINIAVDFDTTKHLSEASIKRRQVVRDRLIMKENERREEERRKAEEEEQKKEKERFDIVTFWFFGKKITPFCVNNSRHTQLAPGDVR